MDTAISIVEIILDDSPVYVTYPDEEIFSEVVGIGSSAEEARRDMIKTFNQMMYSDNGIPLLVEL